MTGPPLHSQLVAQPRLVHMLLCNYSVVVRVFIPHSPSHLETNTLLSSSDPTKYLSYHLLSTYCVFHNVSFHPLNNPRRQISIVRKVRLPDTQPPLGHQLVKSWHQLLSPGLSDSLNTTNGSFSSMEANQALNRRLPSS